MLLMTLVERVATCHRCELRDGATCTVSGGPFLAHAEAGACPDGRFTEPAVARTRPEGYLDEVKLRDTGPRRPCNCGGRPPR